MKEIKFAENLKALRLSRNMKQRELAEKVGISNNAVSNWEKKICEPSLETISKICEIFDETFDNILT